MTEATIGTAASLHAEGDANAGAYRAAARREQRWLGALAWPGLVLIGIVALAPIGWLSWMSFLDTDGFTLEHYRRLLDDNYMQTLKTTFEISFLVTAISVLLGYPLAYLIAQVRPRLGAFLLLLVLFPVWTSLLVRCYAWLVILQRRGVVNTWLQDAGLIEAPLRLMHNFTGTTIGMLHIMLPFMVLPLYASMRSIDRDYLRAAANLGASPVRAFWQVFVPLSLPGLFAGIVIVFVLCLGFYVTPALLGGGRVYMWSMQIERNVTYHADWGAASALGVVLLALTLAILWAIGRVIGFDRIVGSK
ncbi:MAG: ABC transporter permease [Alphaproteobacteria bacterium]|nr:ABC transporter permease [Alphaproteobacteria bacterium]